MADLRALCARLGYEEVKTYVQSGNVVLSSDSAPQEVEAELSRAIGRELGVETPVVVRTREELADVIARDPFGGQADDPKRYQVSFLSGAPDAAAVRALEDQDFAPERFVVSGREIYAWHPAGLQRSRLAAELSDRRLGVTVTARNWNTVTKLVALADD